MGRAEADQVYQIFQIIVGTLALGLFAYMPLNYARTREDIFEDPGFLSSWQLRNILAWTNFVTRINPAGSREHEDALRRRRAARAELDRRAG